MPEVHRVIPVKRLLATAGTVWEIAGVVLEFVRKIGFSCIEEASGKGNSLRTCICGAGSIPAEVMVCLHCADQFGKS
ncbi:MAG: hypothetical protein ACLR1R_10820 [Ruminococcus callidus]